MYWCLFGLVVQLKLTRTVLYLRVIKLCFTLCVEKAYEQRRRAKHKKNETENTQTEAWKIYHRVTSRYYSIYKSEHVYTLTLQTHKKNVQRSCQHHSAIVCTYYVNYSMIFFTILCMQLLLLVNFYIILSLPLSLVRPRPLSHFSPCLFRSSVSVLVSHSNRSLVFPSFICCIQQFQYLSFDCIFYEKE